ncbi:Putative membrane protein [Caballeronia glathei]|jgi:predicted PurR-regulated permease PerM|uniref:Permease n=1 Tax=Caballeronia glathei TaxID=60547 RepID=A0A069Q3F3_9BURK|nr:MULTISPECIES: AI-2E family transporter [Burkholderiaceae]KDR44321.1 permease [Caballeronia glathei]TCK34518.1 putative PurR-regulated permease PerM [Paraburkholderia sp. BL8N3]CDY77608.1 Putative membrane protein [Caballeronia glathei]
MNLKDGNGFAPSARRIVLLLLLAGLAALGYAVLHLFLVPVAWAVIVAYVTWPTYRRLRAMLRGSAVASALLMTVLLTGAFVVPMLSLIVPMTRELTGLYQGVANYLANSHHQLPEFVAKIPWVGTWLQDLLNQMASDPASVRVQVADWAEQWKSEVGQFVGGVGRNATKLGFALVTLFFIYRDGEMMLNQLRAALWPFLGDRLDIYLLAIGGMTRSVVYGLVLTALAQGALAGLGYWAAGVDAPLLLAAVTALVALIPFGTPFVWGSVGAWLLVMGNTVAGVGLLLWGTLVVSWVDNLIRPLVISSAARIPFLLVMFGVLGGLAAFGLIGLFLGPVIVAVLMALWREWQAEQVAVPAATRDPTRL